MPQLQLFLFGPPRLVRDDREVRLTQRKDLALFIYLAVTRQVHHRDALAALFWPESDQKESRAALRRVLHRLRQAVGEQVFEIAQDTVQIAPSANLRLDTRAFQEAISDCKPQDPPLDELPVDCMERLAGAAAQYTGDFLAGFTLHDCPAFDDWQFFEAEGLRQSLARALAQRARFAVHPLGDHLIDDRHAVEAAQIADVDPFAGDGERGPAGERAPTPRACRGNGR